MSIEFLDRIFIENLSVFVLPIQDLSSLPILLGTVDIAPNEVPGSVKMPSSFVMSKRTAFDIFYLLILL